MSCLRMDDAFSTSSSSANSRSSFGFLAVKSWSFMAWRPDWTVMGGTPGRVGRELTLVGTGWPNGPHLVLAGWARARGPALCRLHCGEVRVRGPLKRLG